MRTKGYGGQYDGRDRGGESQGYVGDQQGGDGRRAQGEYRRSERNDRGFFERAGDEVSAWFGDSDAQRRGEVDRHG